MQSPNLNPNLTHDAIRPQDIPPFPYEMPDDRLPPRGRWDPRNERQPERIFVYRAIPISALHD